MKLKLRGSGNRFIKNSIKKRRRYQSHYNNNSKNHKHITHRKDNTTIGIIGNKIKQIAEEYYPPSNMTIYIDEHIFLSNIKNDLDINIQLWIWSGDGTTKDPHEVCLKLDFNHNDKSLFIDEINKCKYKGRKNLTNAIEIAEKLKYDTISLGDFSLIQGKSCSYSLKIYKILLNGESWYNKYGFKSKSHKEEQLKINEIRNDVFRKNIYNFYLKKKDIDFNDILQSLKSIESMYNINVNLLTKTVFKRLDIIRNKLKTEHEKNTFICILSPIIELFKNNIRYDNYLIKGTPKIIE